MPRPNGQQTTVAFEESETIEAFSLLYYRYCGILSEQL